MLAQAPHISTADFYTLRDRQGKPVVWVRRGGKARRAQAVPRSGRGPELYICCIAVSIRGAETMPARQLAPSLAHSLHLSGFTLTRSSTLTPIPFLSPIDSLSPCALSSTAPQPHTFLTVPFVFHALIDREKRDEHQIGQIKG